MFKINVNVSVEYIPNKQQANVTKKHHAPKNKATPFDLTNLYSLGYLSVALRNMI